MAHQPTYHFPVISERKGSKYIQTTYRVMVQDIDNPTKWTPFKKVEQDASTITTTRYFYENDTKEPSRTVTEKCTFDNRLLERIDRTEDRIVTTTYNGDMVTTVTETPRKVVTSQTKPVGGGDNENEIPSR